MTVNTISSIAEFDTNGVTTNFPFYFKFLANEDLVVTYVDPQGVSSTLTLGTHYTVNGAGNDQGGSIVTTSAMAGPGQLIVSREMEAFQQTSLRNQGKFLAETHEDVFDKLTMLVQQGFAKISRALLRPFGKNYYDAEARQIKNLGDPSLAQDAATKSFVQQEIADLLEVGSGSANNAANVLYVPNGPGQIPRPVQGRLRDTFSVRDYIESAIDGTTSNQAGIVAAVNAAYLADAELHWPAGAYVSDANIPYFHEVAHSGKGIIKRGAFTFAASPKNKMTMRNTIHVSPAGASDGLSPSQPAGLSAAIAAIEFRGAALKGLWGISLAAGTYAAPVESLNNVTTDDYILISGPAVAGGVPTAVIDAAGGEWALRIVGRCNVQLQDLKGINATGSSVASAFIIDNGGTVYAQNVHTNNTQWSGINFNAARRAVVYGGRYENSAGYGVRCYGGTILTIGIANDRPQFASCVLAGVVAQGNSYGHVDYCDFTSCGIGVSTVFDSHVASIGCTFTSCATPAQAEHNSSISFSPTTMTGFTRQMRSRQGVQVYDGAEGRFDEQTYPYLGTNGKTAYGYSDWLVPTCKFQYSNGGTSAGFNLSSFAAATALWESSSNTILALAAPDANYSALWLGNSTSARHCEVRGASGSLSLLFNGVSSYSATTTRLAPSTDNDKSLGLAAQRFSVVYAGTGTINTSDERSKQQIKLIDEACLRAWAKVEYMQYKFNDAVDSKADSARWHFGLIAQRVKEAFEAEGLDAFEYGLLCYDEWEAAEADCEHVKLGNVHMLESDGSAGDILHKGVEEYMAEEGVSVWEFTHDGVIVNREAVEAGNRYGIRYEEALALECAYLRSMISANKAG